MAWWNHVVFLDKHHMLVWNLHMLKWFLQRTEELLSQYTFLFLSCRSLRLHFVVHWKRGSQLTKHHPRRVFRWVCFYNFHWPPNRDTQKNVLSLRSWLMIAWRLSTKNGQYVNTEVVFQTRTSFWELWTLERGHLFIPILCGNNQGKGKINTWLSNFSTSSKVFYATVSISIIQYCVEHHCN